MNIFEREYKRGNLIFRTTSQLESKDWYAWKIWISGPAGMMKKINEVEYILHPSFPHRIRRFKNAETGFLLESEGWGEFDIVVNVFYRGGDENTFIVPLELG